jgi:hypothetical protein
LDFGFWILDFGFWILDFGFWILDFGFWILDFGWKRRFVAALCGRCGWEASEPLRRQGRKGTRSRDDGILDFLTEGNEGKEGAALLVVHGGRDFILQFLLSEVCDLFLPAP